ncbi:MAG: GntR family transcriptional regulator [Sneathiella sp.]|uniref:GntR family transcriptional regulator n=1 Tax=Sneathiella sp. TaxID=1964365 RepID=UPI0030010769
MKSIESITPLKRKTLQTEVYRQLCSLILEGGLAPGESFTIASIANALQVSPMPVREAVTRLMAEKALTIVSGRSMGVPDLNKTSFEDLKNVRVEIESLALKWAMRNTSPKFIADLEEKLIIMIAAEKSSEVKGFIRANYNFHFAIYNHANSPILYNLISNLWLRISPYLHVLSESGHYKISNEQHHNILAAVKMHDVEKATASLIEDITSAYDTLVATLITD